jgi:hypothetical protein
MRGPGSSCDIPSLVERAARADKRIVKLLARHLLLAALLLRALVPLGWMPGAPQLGQAAWIICSADGQIGHGTPGKDDSRQHEQPCAFAGLHVIAAPDVPVFAAPSLRATALAPRIAATVAVRAARFTTGAPRAPPAFS